MRALMTRFGLVIQSKDAINDGKSFSTCVWLAFDLRLNYVNLIIVDQNAFHCWEELYNEVDEEDDPQPTLDFLDSSATMSESRSHNLSLLMNIKSLFRYDWWWGNLRRLRTVTIMINLLHCQLNSLIFCLFDKLST